MGFSWSTQKWSFLVLKAENQRKKRRGRDAVACVSSLFWNGGKKDNFFSSLFSPFVSLFCLEIR